MDTLVIEGGTPLEGEVQIAGAKNSVLPILIASLLTEETLTITRAPYLKDVSNVLQLLSSLGVNVNINFISSSSINLQAGGQVSLSKASRSIANSMRASIVCLGPLLTRFGKAELASPGGCIIGERPIDIHLDGLKQMGAIFDESQSDVIIASVPKGRLEGCDIQMKMPSVTGTENLMLAATLAKGITILRNSAKEPEVIDLAECLNSMGAKIAGHGTDVIYIEGVDKLHGAEHAIMPDRIEAATYLIAGAMTQGKIRVSGVNVEHLRTASERLQAANALITCGDDWVEVDARNRQLKAVDLTTQPFPGFPTDLQAQFVALNAIAAGRGCVTESVFEGRFKHVKELQKMGAKLEQEGNQVFSDGVSELNAAVITASDLRASASLVLAGLVANGKTIIKRVHHIDRGYELIEEKMSRLGAQIYRVHTS